ncbi:MAG: hypothetical protein NTW13_00070, partial [Candidatus Omnitrophica bacterium]|nr:hypothetical protein [Candidatus Omnitrophota bacterium]
DIATKGWDIDDLRMQAAAERTARLFDSPIFRISFHLALSRYDIVRAIYKSEDGRVPQDLIEIYAQRYANILRTLKHTVDTIQVSFLGNEYPVFNEATLAVLQRTLDILGLKYTHLDESSPTAVILPAGMGNIIYIEPKQIALQGRGEEFISRLQYAAYKDRRCLANEGEEHKDAAMRPTEYPRVELDNVGTIKVRDINNPENVILSSTLDELDPIPANLGPNRAAAAAPVGKAEPHSYTIVSESDKQTIFEELKEHNQAQLKRYIQRLIEGIKSKPCLLKLIFKEDSVECLSGLYLNKERIFHYGLLRDEAGILWIVKKHLTNARSCVEGREEKNFPECEMFAYLLAEGIANFAQIRFLEEEEIKALPIFGEKTVKLRDYYLVRLVTTRNMPQKDLVCKDASQAYCSAFVAHILMRNFDPHLGNMSFSEDIPVFLDNDEANRFEDFPNDLGRLGYEKFQHGFLEHSILMVLDELIFIKGIILNRSQYRANNLFFEDEERIMSELRKIGVPLRFEILAIVSSIMQDFGVGSGFMSAQMLEAGHIRWAIQKF